MNSVTPDPRQALEPIMPRSVAYVRPYQTNVDTEDGDDMLAGMKLGEVMRRRWKLLIAPAIILVVLVTTYCLVVKPTYKSETSVLLQWQQNGNTLGAVLGTQASSVASMLGSSGAGTDVPTQIEVMTSDEVLQGVASKLHITAPLWVLRRQLNLTPDKASVNVVDLSAVAETPEMSRNILLEMINQYEKQLSSEDATVNGRNAKLVRQQIATTSHDLAVSEDRFAAYSKLSGSISPDTESSKRVQGLFDLQTEYLDANQKVNSAEAERDYLRGQIAQTPQAIVPSLTFAQNNRIEAAKGQLNDLEATRAQLAMRYTPKDDEMVANQQQIDNVKQEIINERSAQENEVTEQDARELAAKPSPGYVISGGIRELNPLRQDLTARIITAEATIEAEQAHADAVKRVLRNTKHEFETVPNTMRRMTDLKDDVDVNRRIYDALRLQLTNLLSSSGQQRVFAKLLVMPPLPKSPNNPRPLLYIPLAAFAGLVIGFLLIIGAESTDARVRNERDIDRFVGLPVIGEMKRKQLIKGGSTVKILASSTDSADIRRIASSLCYLGVGKSVRSLLLTSAVVGEGVTFTSSQLALELASLGKKVILVDANLRNPGLHTYFGLSNSVSEGFAGVMRNGAQPDNALVAYSGEKPLQLVTSGNLDNSTVSELLNPEKLSILIGALKDRADIVLIDSPAILDGSETATLADKVDGTLIVAAISFAKRGEVARAAGLLATCNAPILGVIINDPVSKTK